MKKIVNILEGLLFLPLLAQVIKGSPQSFGQESFLKKRERNTRSVNDCVWNKDSEFSTYPPLLMDKATWTSILPVTSNGTREVRIPSGTAVVIACPETTITATGTEVTEGVCNGGSVLDVGGTNYNMMELGCQSRVKEGIQKNVTTCACGEGEISIIGFDVTGYEFYELVQVCFDTNKENSLYTYHLLRGASVDASDGNPTRPSFRKDTGFYTVSPNNCYKIAAQEVLMGVILGDSSVIDSGSSLYFARGHLAPDADFVTEMEADATYYYINVVPQWQRINNGNWKYMEMEVRDLASNHGTDFKVWTGTWNVLQLSNVDIYLGLTENKAVLPAPDVMWKVVYEPSSDRGVAFIGANNPYLTVFPPKICNDICFQLSWMSFNLEDLSKGAMYCCTVEDLHQAIGISPDLGPVGVLTN